VLASNRVEQPIPTPPPRPARRLGKWLLSVPVFVKVLGIAVGMAVLLGAGMLWQIHETWHAHLVRDLEQRGRKVAEQTASHCAELLQAGRAAEIPAELQRALAEFPDAVRVLLQDTNGTTLAEARAESSPDASQRRALAVLAGQGPQTLWLELSLARVNQEVGWLTRRLALGTVIIALLGMLAAWWLTRIFARPIKELVGVTRAVKAGNYRVKAAVQAGDEVGELAAAFNEMTDTLGQKETVRQQLLRRVIHAGEDERKRIARELHDHTGQALTSQIAALGALENQCADELMRQRLTELRQQTEQTLSEVHDLSVALRPSVLDDIGLMAALERHCRLFAERFGIKVACGEVGLDDRRLPPEVELTIYRVVQEALTNAVRHGRTQRVQALVQRTPAGVLATIQDDGCGFDARDWQKRCAEGNHLGLLGLEERVTLLDGSFCVESEPGKGVTVYADIPLKETP
jgi:signal transduction histidine kinase